MKLLAFTCLVIAFMANAGEQLTAKGKDAINHPIGVDLQLLQGTWEGVMVGDEARQKITVQITGNSLHFYRDADFWFETTITLPEGKEPKQLHATIKGGPPSQAVSMGK